MHAPIEARSPRRGWRGVVAAVVVTVVACGGGGGDEDPAPWSGVTIEAPTDAATFATDQATLALAGRAFVPAGSRCDAAVGTLPPGYRVRWRNAANGRSGAVDAVQLNCLLAVSVTWTATGLPLEPGANTVTVTASAADGETGHDTLQVQRTSPPPRP